MKQLRDRNGRTAIARLALVSLLFYIVQKQIGLESVAVLFKYHFAFFCFYYVKYRIEQIKKSTIKTDPIGFLRSFRKTYLNFRAKIYGCFNFLKKIVTTNKGSSALVLLFDQCLVSFSFYRTKTFILGFSALIFKKIFGSLDIFPSLK